MIKPTLATKVLVKITPRIPEEQLSNSDKNVEPYVTVCINDDVAKEDWANCALDVYHNLIPIKVLDHFEFKVYFGNDELFENRERTSCSLKDSGYI